MLTAPLNVSSGLADYEARDAFNQSSGSLHGKALPVGGAWSTLDPAGGSSGDFQVDASDKQLERNTGGGRYGLAGSDLHDAILVKCDVLVSNFKSTGGTAGVMARYDAANGHVQAYVGGSSSGSDPKLVLAYSNGSVSTGKSAPGFVPRVDTWYTIWLWINADDRATAWLAPRGGLPELMVATTISADSFPFGGTVPGAGRIGLYDQNSTSGDGNRYDNFAAWVPDPDAVLYAGQSASLRTDGMVRQDSTGTAYGSVSLAVGQIPRMPQSGSEGRPVELMWATSRGDMDQLPDSGLDDISVTPKYRPCYLTVPGS